MNSTQALNPSILREYDIRGVVGETLTALNVEGIGKAFGTLLIEKVGPNPRVVVGYDGRLSSPDMSDALCLGLASTGVNVINIGVGPTPMLYFATYHLDTAAGLMITGSHNPPEFNGIKMMLLGHSFFGNAIQDLGARVSAGQFHRGNGAIKSADVSDAYIDRLLECVGCAGLDLRVAWDPGNGASGDIVRRLTSQLGGDHILLNEEIDGTFPNHHPDPTIEDNLEQLKTVVRRQGCDLGIGLDGDGDRIGVVDSQGRVLWGDQLMVVWARDVLLRHPGATIIADVKTSQVFYNEVKKAGGTPLMWKTGHSLIKSKMFEMKSPLAGEMSGHIFFADEYYGFDDAVYAALRLLRILTLSGESIDDIKDQLREMHNTPELRFECPDEKKFQIAEDVRQRLAKNKDVTIHTIDGIRVETRDGWWLLRASNTQPVLVARCESDTERGLQRLKDALAAQLRASGVAPPDFG